MRFPENGSRMGPDMTLELTRIDPRIDLPVVVPRWPSDPRYPDLRYPMPRIGHYFMFY